MSKTTCPRETQVAQATRSSDWPASLSAHIANCAVCREVAETSRWMAALSQAAPDARPDADASLLWWRAQLRERAAIAGKTRAPMDFAYLLLLAVGTGFTIWAGLNRDAFGYASEWLAVSVRPETWMSTGGLNFLGTGISWSIAGAAIIVAIFVAFPALIED